MPPREGSSRWDDGKERDLLLSIILTHLTEKKSDSSLQLRNVNWDSVNEMMTRTFDHGTTPGSISQRMTKKILKEHAKPDKSKESAEVPGKSSGKSTTAAKDNVEGKPQVRKRKATTAFGANSERAGDHDIQNEGEA